MAFKSNTAESVVNGPFPCCIGVTVENYTAFCFACAFFDSCYIVAGFFFEKLVNSFFIKTKLKNTDDKT